MSSRRNRRMQSIINEEVNQDDPDCKQIVEIIQSEDSFRQSYLAILKRIQEKQGKYNHKLVPNLAQIITDSFSAPIVAFNAMYLLVRASEARDDTITDRIAANFFSLLDWVAKTAVFDCMKPASERGKNFFSKSPLAEEQKLGKQMVLLCIEAIYFWGEEFGDSDPESFHYILYEKYEEIRAKGVGLKKYTFVKTAQLNNPGETLTTQQSNRYKGNSPIHLEGKDIAGGFQNAQPIEQKSYDPPMSFRDNPNNQNEDPSKSVSNLPMSPVKIEYAPQANENSFPKIKPQELTSVSISSEPLIVNKMPEPAQNTKTVVDLRNLTLTDARKMALEAQESERSKQNTERARQDTERSNNESDRTKLSKDRFRLDYSPQSISSPITDKGANFGPNMSNAAPPQNIPLKQPGISASVTLEARSKDPVMLKSQNGPIGGFNNPVFLAVPQSNRQNTQVELEEPREALRASSIRQTNGNEKSEAHHEKILSSETNSSLALSDEMNTWRQKRDDKVPPINFSNFASSENNTKDHLEIRPEFKHQVQKPVENRLEPIKQENLTGNSSRRSGSKPFQRLFEKENGEEEVFITGRNVREKDSFVTRSQILNSMDKKEDEKEILNRFRQYKDDAGFFESGGSGIQEIDKQNQNKPSPTEDVTFFAKTDNTAVKNPPNRASHFDVLVTPKRGQNDDHADRYNKFRPLNQSTPDLSRSRSGSRSPIRDLYAIQTRILQSYHAVGKTPPNQNFLRTFQWSQHEEIVEEYVGAEGQVSSIQNSFYKACDESFLIQPSIQNPLSPVKIEYVYNHKNEPNYQNNGNNHDPNGDHQIVGEYIHDPWPAYKEIIKPIFPSMSQTLNLQTPISSARISKYSKDESHIIESSRPKYNDHSRRSNALSPSQISSFLHEYNAMNWTERFEPKTDRHNPMIGKSLNLTDRYIEDRNLASRTEVSPYNFERNISFSMTETSPMNLQKNIKMANGNQYHHKSSKKLGPKCSARKNTIVLNQSNLLQF